MIKRGYKSFRMNNDAEIVRYLNNLPANAEVTYVVAGAGTGDYTPEIGIFWISEEEDAES